MLNRPTISVEMIDNSISGLREKILSRLIEKGDGSFASIHEGLGIIAEEYAELIDEVRANDYDGICRELLDIEVACVFLRTCLKQNTMDW